MGFQCQEWVSVSNYEIQERQALRLHTETITFDIKKVHSHHKGMNEDKPGSKFAPPVEMIAGSANNIIFLARADKHEYLESLLQGKLRASHIANYKKEENRGQSFFDENEAIDAIFDPKKIIIKISKSGQELAELIPENEDQQLKVFRESDIPVMCFYSLHTGLELTKPFPKGQKTAEKIDVNLEVTDHIGKFGAHVWVIENVTELNRRIDARAKELGLTIRHGLVEYTNLKAIHGRMPTNKWGLVKDVSYAEEREYRYLFVSKEKLPNPFIFDVGCLADISRIVPMDDFRSSYKVTIEYENNN